MPKPDACKKWQDHEGVIVELRGNGGQTMFPPSSHPSGELVEFDKAGVPTTISWQELESAVLELAVATEIYESYTDGCRHDIALALAGLLRRAGWSQQRTESFIEKLAHAHRDNEIGDRRRCVKDSYVMEIPFGLPRLAELTNELTAECVARWIGYHEKTSSATAPNGISLETDLDCANVFVAEHKDKIIYDALAEQFYRRQSGVYVPVTDVEIQGLVQSHGGLLDGTIPRQGFEAVPLGGGRQKHHDHGASPSDRGCKELRFRPAPVRREEWRVRFAHQNADREPVVHRDETLRRDLRSRRRLSPV